MDNLFLKIFICAVIFVTIPLIWRLTSSIGTYLYSKATYYDVLSKIQIIKTPSVKVSNTADVIEIIRTLIGNEVTIIMKSNIQLSTKYELLNFDRDVEIIAKKVYESIDPSVFVNNTCLLTTEYLQNFIVSETITIFLNAINLHNNRIREI